MSRRDFFGAVAAALFGQRRVTAWAARREVKRIVHRALFNALAEQEELMLLYGDCGARNALIAHQVLADFELHKEVRLPASLFT